MSLYIGTAGWSVPSRYADQVPANGTHLQRYAKRLNAVEINTSFYRPHQRKTYERWARSTPSSFRFSVKVPKAITHEARLRYCGEMLDRFVEEVDGLGDKLGVLLVQVPSNFLFSKRTVGQFFRDLRSRTDIPAVIEPRHASWFTADVDAWLAEVRISRVAADPAPVVHGGMPGGWQGILYHRLHGSPRMYFSPYDATTLSLLKNELDNEMRRAGTTWCIFDNTASGAALGNALNLSQSFE